MASCTTQAKHDRLATHKLSTPLCEHKITAAQKSAAAKPLPVVHTAISCDMQPLHHASARLWIVNYVYTATCSYNAICGYPDCCTRVYMYIQFTLVIHVTACELHSCPEVCEVSLISKVYNRYPKSIIISSGSSTGAQNTRKFSIFDTGSEVRTE